MSKNCKSLKILSFIQVVVALACIFLAIIARSGAALAEEEAGFAGVILMYLDNFLYGACGVLTIITAIMGIHGANRPSRLGSHRLIAIITALFAILTIVVAGLGQGIPSVALLVLILSIAVAILDGMCRAELDR